MPINAYPQGFAPLPKTLPKRYVPIRQIGEGGVGRVYCVFDRLTNQTVALKQFKNLLGKNTEEWVVQDRVSIIHEFKTLSRLRHPYILPALDFGFDQAGSAFFTMPFLDEPPTILKYARNQPFEVQVNLLMQVLQALVYLHRHGIIHNDLTPNNILIVDEQVQILDFGLATLVGEQRNFLAGTIRYIAPEIMRVPTPSHEGDLYAVGVLAYDVFCGGAADPRDERPTPEAAQSLPVDNQVRMILASLLAENPADRKLDFQELVRAYTARTGRTLPYAELVTQDSFLNAAPFTGRKPELTRLTGALNALAAENRGGFWLVGGESGIGKSRLLDELRVEALTKKIVVLRGQATSELNRPFQLWEETIGWLLLTTPVNDIELAILRTALPNLGLYIDRVVPAAPPLDAKAAQQRFLDTLEVLFQRNNTPLLIILEDIHWLNADSLTLLAGITQRLLNVSALLVASYRNDEAPLLADQIPHAQRLNLRQLDTLQLTNLIQAMLGQQASDKFLEFVQAATDGNPFFAIEVARALAEAAGDLQSVDVERVPDHREWFQRDNLLRRRIQIVPAFVQPFLAIAAIIGRSFDAELIHRIQPQNPSESWTAICAERGVLEPDGHSWRFAHDRLKEAILAEIPEAERRTLHHRVAQTLERFEGSSDSASARLAYHWQHANNPLKEAPYRARAGALYMAQHNYQAAAADLKRTLELESVTPQLSRSERAYIKHLYGEALFASGQMHDGEHQLYESLRDYEVPPPSVFNLTRAMLQQFWSRAAHVRNRKRAPLKLEQQRVASIARACERLAQINYVNNHKLESVYLAFAGLNMSEWAGNTAKPEQARFYGSMALAFGLVSQHRLARYYLRQADTVAQTVTNADALTWMNEVTATYLAGCGRWREAEARLLKGIQLSKQIGDKRRLLECAGFLAAVYEHQACWDALARLYDEFERADPRREDPQARCWHLVTRCTHLLLIGQPELAFDWVTELDGLLQKIDDITTKMRGWGFLTLYFLHYQLPDVATTYARELLHAMSSTPPVAFPVLESYVAGTVFALWNWSTSPSPETKATARKVCRAMNRFARAFAIGRPYAAACTGWYWGLSGNSKRAVRFAEKGLREANELTMPGAAATAYAVLLHYLPADDARRDQFAKLAIQNILTTSIRIDLLLPQLSTE